MVIIIELSVKMTKTRRVTRASKGTKKAKYNVPKTANDKQLRNVVFSTITNRVLNDKQKYNNKLPRYYFNKLMQDYSDDIAWLTVDNIKNRVRAAEKKVDKTGNHTLG